MEREKELTDLRNDVLRRIGRNVVNFQKMEGMLKLLCSLQALNGPLSDIAKIAERTSNSVARQPMGRLADAFVRSVYSCAGEDDQLRRDPREVTISFSLRIESDSELAKERKKALSSIVAARNKLIHQWLAAFDPNSLESCERLAAALDEQHARIWPEFEILKSMVEALKECLNEVRRYAASDDFLIELKRGQWGA
jgi:hypothetical protein